ncbi:hypothetical protein BH11ACT8_BH11ACT8_25530 [soil metagenome]
MSDGMTQDVVPPPSPTTTTGAADSGRRLPSRRQIAEPVLVLVAFAAAGLGGGWLWEQLWTPTKGGVVDGTWYSGTRVEGDFLVGDYPGLRHYFDATASFVFIGIVAGLVLAVVAALLTRRSELVMLVAVAAGSALACWLAYRLGTHLGPPDPAIAAKTADNGTLLDTNLSLKGKSPFVGWSLGALLGLVLTFFLTTGVAEVRRREVDDSRWLSRNQTG